MSSFADGVQEHYGDCFYGAIASMVAAYLQRGQGGARGAAELTLASRQKGYRGPLPRGRPDLVCGGLKAHPTAF